MKRNKKKLLIFLIGFMCSGKTTLGQAIARELPAVRFVDLDDYIETRCGCTVREIFNRHGEDTFRRLESEALETLVAEASSAAAPHTIVACGGGTPCFGDNMRKMNSAGITVWLQPSERVLLRRLALGRDTRPLLAGMDDEALLGYAHTLLEKRREHYEKASTTFDSSRLDTVDEVASTTKIFIDQFIK